VRVLQYFVKASRYNPEKYVSSYVLTVVSKKTTIFWNVSPYTPIEMYRRFENTDSNLKRYNRSHSFTFNMMTAHGSETSLNFYRTTRRHTPEDSSFYNTMAPNGPRKSVATPGLAALHLTTLQYKNNDISFRAANAPGVNRLLSNRSR
jgi:hypothetical protein